MSMLADILPCGCVVDTEWAYPCPEHRKPLTTSQDYLRLLKIKNDSN